MATILADQGTVLGGKPERYVYRFGGGISDGAVGERDLLGGKGSNLAEMASIGLPVPPGFTISTEMCTRYYDEGETFPESVKTEVANGVAHIEGITAKLFGDAANPLLVSVRSGARVSMPGMMDTVLMAVIPPASPSARKPASIMSPPRPIACRSRGWRPRRPC